MRKLSLYLFLVFVFTVPWQNAFSIGGSKTLSSLVGVAALVVALVTCLLSGKIIKPPAYFFAFGAFVMWQLTTYFWSLDPGSTLGRAATMIQMLAMVWLLSELCTSERERLQLVQAFVLGCVVVCLVLIRAYLSGQALEGIRYVPAGFNPNESADIIAAGLPMALLVAMSTKRSVLAWLNIVYLPLGLFAVVLTASRGGFIAACLGLLSIFFALRNARPLYRVVWLAIILMVFAGLFFGIPANNRLEANIQRITFSTDTRSLGTLTGRTTIWSAGLAIFAQHPLVGIGANTFEMAAEEQLGTLHAPHNLWVEVAAETGIIGLIVLAVTLGTAIAPALARRDPRMGFHLILFLVLMTDSLAANVVTNKALWIGLGILAVTMARPEARLASEVGTRRLDAPVSIMRAN